MRHFALALLIIFTFNLVSELGAGHCDESGAESHHSQISETSAPALEQDHSKEEPSPDCAQICHFGHCGHLIVRTFPALKFKSLEALYGVSAIQHVEWRSLTPLFKPPIA